MCSEHLIVDVDHVDKSFLLYDKPSHRLWQMLLGRRRTFYREHQVLRDINFKVPRGQTLGLVGRNGAGKSTLLSILCGTLAPSAGVAQVYGRVAALLELGAGFNPELTGRENIDLCAQIYGLSEEQIRVRRDSIIEFADIGDYIDRPVKTYSSGMFTRLGFSVVAHVDADVLIVDEALAVGDAYFVQKCMRFLHRFRGAGGTLIFVSHDMGAVTALCDRVIWLRDGRVFMDASPKEVAAAYLADLYDAEPTADVAGPAEFVIDQSEDKEEEVDGRLVWLNHTQYRNDIQLGAFNASHDFGVRGAEFINGGVYDRQGRRLTWVVGGERVELRLRIRAAVSIRSLIVGFVVKDRQGQPLFGDNSYLTHRDKPIDVKAGDTLDFYFRFRMPVLPAGDYSVSAAISDGVQEEHVMHQWVHDALILNSRASSVATGLIGIPMLEIGYSMVEAKGGGQ
ncbi:ABC transporter ATP-binding protein [Stenotrophomonas maltophilia]|uniref:ABC transporter ATP-binding protein n=1 Tax=Stenotrophomonas maltophilia TaxID=40324 RepID=UPI000DA9DB71|nr:ABC transporter ATP-binding protein [Stenotrophomonas maltophilia]PZT27411.1 ABC transporter ATP-binding protein [Stenotrophomonas maltophilia]